MSYHTSAPRPPFIEPVIVTGVEDLAVKIKDKDLVYSFHCFQDDLVIDNPGLNGHSLTIQGNNVKIKGITNLYNLQIGPSARNVYADDLVTVKSHLVLEGWCRLPSLTKIGGDLRANAEAVTLNKLKQIGGILTVNTKVLAYPI